MHYQRSGFGTLTVYIFTNHVRELVDYIKNAFGAELQAILNRKDGSTMHEEIEIGDSILMTGAPSNEKDVTKTSLYLPVPDCDMVYEKANSHGSISIMDPTYTYHAEDRYGCIKEIQANIWRIATKSKTFLIEKWLDVLTKWGFKQAFVKSFVKKYDLHK